MNYPKITIVTPSYNQGNFLEETILSVLGQNYPNLEFIIIDGGSNDNSVEIIKKYEDKLTYWVSEKDKGQSHAINKGFAIATGEILAWLNSDDMYLPGVLHSISKTIDLSNQGIYFGDCVHFKYQNDALTCYGSQIYKDFQNNSLTVLDFIIQPSSFWTRKTWENVGALNENMHYAFDWEWFIRAKQVGVAFNPIKSPLSLYRIHEAHKTGTGGSKRQKEISEIYQEYNPELHELYNSLCEETLLIKSSLIKLINNLLRLLTLPPSYGVVLKLLKYYKYYPYSICDINQVSSML